MVSPRKTASTVSTASRWDNMSLPAKSCESLFSGSSRESASQIYQRKPTQRSGNNNGGIRQPSMVTSNTNSDIHQRVMSARNLRAKTFQNQLADAQAEISNLAHENRMLRTMHKRQSMALNKYESTGAELPQLLHSHAEELRVWQTKHRNVQSINKELEHKLKQKEAQILSLSDQNKHFSQLIKDKNLDERQKLQDKLRLLEQRLQEKDNDMKLMARKVQLESKNFRQQLLNEQKKCKEVMLKLEKARLEMSGYRKLEEFTVDKANPLASGRRAKLTAVEETDKIDKLEKSLDMLDKAIEKNNQSEFNALTDVLETQSNFDFDKDDIDEEKSGGSLSDEQDNNDIKPPARAKLTLPPANTQPKPIANNLVNPSRLSLSQMLHQTKPSVGIKTNSRLRSGGVVGGSVANIASNLNKQQNKRRDGDVLAKHVIVQAQINKQQTMSKSLNFEYDDDSEHLEEDDDDGDSLGKMCHENDDNEEDVNPNDVSPINYAAYLDTKCELADMLDMEGEEEESFEEDDVVSPKRVTNEATQKINSRAPIMKENMSGIRKLISDDYKERESFLDNHCRPTSGSNNVRDDPIKKKRNNITTDKRHNIPNAAPTGGNHLVGSRKHALLAALKVIDDNKDED